MGQQAAPDMLNIVAFALAGIIILVAVAICIYAAKGMCYGCCDIYKEFLKLPTEMPRANTTNERSQLHPQGQGRAQSNDVAINAVPDSRCSMGTVTNSNLPEFNLTSSSGNGTHRDACSVATNNTSSASGNSGACPEFSNNTISSSGYRSACPSAPFIENTTSSSRDQGARPIVIDNATSVIGNRRGQCDNTTEAEPPPSYEEAMNYPCK